MSTRNGAGETLICEIKRTTGWSERDVCGVLEVREPDLWPTSGAVPSANCAMAGATFPLAAERLVAVSRGWRSFARSEVHPFFAFPLSSWATQPTPLRRKGRQNSELVL